MNDDGDGPNDRFKSPEYDAAVIVPLVIVTLGLFFLLAYPVVDAVRSYPLPAIPQPSAP